MLERYKKTIHEGRLLQITFRHRQATAGPEDEIPVATLVEIFKVVELFKQRKAMAR